MSTSTQITDPFDQVQAEECAARSSQYSEELAKGFYSKSHEEMCWDILYEKKIQKKLHTSSNRQWNLWWMEDHGDTCVEEI